MDLSVPAFASPGSSSWADRIGLFGTSTPAKWARVVMLACAVGWAWLLVQFAGEVKPLWAVAFEHAAEGGLVGGACDWFAVSQVWSKARKHFHEVADGFALVVVNALFPAATNTLGPAQARLILESPEARRKTVDFLQSHLPDRASAEAAIRTPWVSRVRPRLVDWMTRVELRSRLLGFGNGPSLLDQPAIRYALERCLRRVLSDDAHQERLRELLLATGRGVDAAAALGLARSSDARELVRRLHDDHGREAVVSWLTKTDLRAAVIAPSGRPGLLEDATIRAVVAHGLRHATRDAGRAHRLHDALKARFGDTVVVRYGPFSVTAGLLLDLFLGEDRLHERITGLADLIESPPGEGGEALQRSLNEYVVAYLEGWQQLPESQRRRAAERLHDELADRLLDGAGDALFEALHGRTVEDLLGRFVTPKLFRESLDLVADLLARPPSAQGPSWTVALRSYAGTWLETWQALDEAVRREAAAQLVSVAEPVVIATLADALWTLRTDITTSGWNGHLGDVAWLRDLVESLGRLIEAQGDLRAKTRDFIADYVKGKHPDVFIGQLKAQAGEKLDKIQFSGAVLGCGLGLMGGLLAVWAD